jgi:hypothetical protein
MSIIDIREMKIKYKYLNYKDYDDDWWRGIGEHETEYPEWDDVKGFPCKIKLTADNGAKTIAKIFSICVGCGPA